MAQPTAPAQQGPYFAIDVECVATGTDHNSRAVAQISLVDRFENVILNLYVKPDVPVVSYMTPLTGVTGDMIEAFGMQLHDALTTLRQHLPRNAILVGQNIGQDVKWLGLKEGVDFAGLMDLAGMYRVFNPQFNTWSVFSQDQVALVLLNWPVDQGGGGHNAVLDARKSMSLFNYYHQLQAQPEKWQAAQQALLAAPPLQSFAKQHPVLDGVCMGNRRACSCGAPFYL